MDFFTLLTFFLFAGAYQLVHRFNANPLTCAFLVALPTPIILSILNAIHNFPLITPASIIIIIAQVGVCYFVFKKSTHIESILGWFTLGLLGMLTVSFFIPTVVHQFIQ